MDSSSAMESLDDDAMFEDSPSTIDQDDVEMGEQGDEAVGDDAMVDSTLADDGDVDLTSAVEPEGVAVDSDDGDVVLGSFVDSDVDSHDIALYDDSDREHVVVRKSQTDGLTNGLTPGVSLNGNMDDFSPVSVNDPHEYETHADQGRDPIDERTEPLYESHEPQTVRDEPLSEEHERQGAYQNDPHIEEPHEPHNEPNELQGEPDQPQLESNEPHGESKEASTQGQHDLIEGRNEPQALQSELKTKEPQTTLATPHPEIHIEEPLSTAHSVAGNDDYSHEYEVESVTDGVADGELQLVDESGEDSTDSQNATTQQPETEGAEQVTAPTCPPEEAAVLIVEDPIMLNYDGQRYSLFSPTGSKIPEALIPDPRSDLSLEQLLFSLRKSFQERDIPCDIDEELVLDFPQLTLSINEDNIYCTQVFFTDILTIFSLLKANSSTEEYHSLNLEINLLRQPRFITTFNYLSRITDEKLGFEHLVERQGHEGQAEPYDEQTDENTDEAEEGEPTLDNEEVEVRGDKDGYAQNGESREGLNEKKSDDGDMDEVNDDQYNGYEVGETDGAANGPDEPSQLDELNGENLDGENLDGEAEQAESGNADELPMRTVNIVQEHLDVGTPLFDDEDDEYLLRSGINTPVKRAGEESVERDAKRTKSG